QPDDLRAWRLPLWAQAGRGPLARCRGRDGPALCARASTGAGSWRAGLVVLARRAALVVLGGPVPAVATVLSCRTRWPPIDACGRRVGVWIGLFGPSCWRFDANLTPCCGYRGINPHFVAEISTELSRTVKYCPDIHNTVGLGYLQ